MTKAKRITLCITCVFCGLLLALTAIVAAAYFSKKEIYDGYFSGEVELLFDRLNDDGTTAYHTAADITVAEGQELTWGSEEYPYVISNVRHLYNLSELQRLGYFDKQHISQNADGEYNNIPYFLVCTPEYTPVVIDGTNFKAITSIGTDEYPFIGSIRGVTSEDTAITVNFGEERKLSYTSVLYNIQINGKPANADVGLFGHVSYLGDSSEIDADTGAFNGQVSTISDLVLCDLRVSVQQNDPLWDGLTAFLEDIAKIAAEQRTDPGHQYAFSELYGTDSYDLVPHENHHLGILAGHVSYAVIEYISVYYSSDDIAAIDLSDVTVLNGVKANYLSATGIIGFVYNLNPTVNVDEEDGSTSVTAGSGTSMGDLSYSSSVGGGGALTGDNAGYVLAKEIYDTYKYTLDENNTPIQNEDDDTFYIKDAVKAEVDEDGNITTTTPLCHEWVSNSWLGGGPTGKYYFYDGVFTFALSSEKDTIEPTWTGPEPDVFAIGENDDSKWVENTEKGQYNVHAYIKQIKSNSELLSAIQSEKPILVAVETNDGNLCVMTLQEGGKYEDTEHTFSNGRYYINASTLSLLSKDDVYEMYVPTDGDDPLEYDENKISYTSKAAFLQDIQNGNLLTIDLGLTGGSMNLETLEDKYKVTVNKTGNVKYFAGNIPVTIKADGTAADFYLYPMDATYNETQYEPGYFYYKYEKQEGFLGSSTTTYKYYWQTETDVYLIGEGKYEIDSWFDDGAWANNGITLNDDPTTGLLRNAQGNNWNGETVYKYTFTEANGQTHNCIGIVVNLTDYEFQTTEEPANASGSILTKDADDVPYIYHPVGEEAYYYTDGTTVYTVIERDPSGTTETGATTYQVTYKKNGTSTMLDRPAILLEEYPLYTLANIYSDSNGNEVTKYLYMIGASFKNKPALIEYDYGTYYTLWANDADNVESYGYTYGGDNTNISLDGDSVMVNNNAIIKFNDNDENNMYCYIQYVIGKESAFVKAAGTLFNTASSNTDSATKVNMYTIEGTLAQPSGRITYDPIKDDDSVTDAYQFSTGKYVLYTTNGQTQDAPNNQTAYEVLSLVDLPNTRNSNGEVLTYGWNNSVGSVLAEGDLVNKFKMLYGISIGTKTSLGPIYENASAGIVTAPVGSDGVEADIPQSCIAFKLNSSGEEKKIRVILSVAVSAFYPGETDYDLNYKDTDTGYIYEYTRYYNLWKMDESGTNLVQEFNAGAFLERFEVPRSHPYEPGKTAAESEYITVTYGGNEYRCYLNGDRVLLAYEFTVSDEGIYCLGMSGEYTTTDGDTIETHNVSVPMEIVYFSADGVASVGRDGSSGSQIGSIDFVYDYKVNENDEANTIITVKDSSDSATDGTEDYSTYYPSYCLLHFDTSQTTGEPPVFVSVNNEKVYIRRWVAATAASDGDHNSTSSFSRIEATLEGDKYVLISQYSRFSDNVWIPPESTGGEDAQTPTE